MAVPTDTLPGTPESPESPASPAGEPAKTDAVQPRIVPVRRTGQWVAAAAVLLLLAGALRSVIGNDAFQSEVVADYFTSAAVLRGGILSAERGQIEAAESLGVATVWYTVVTSVLSVGQHNVEKYYARGTAGAR